MTSIQPLRTINSVRRHLFLAGAATLACALLNAPALAQTPAAINKVVFQVSDNDPAKWGLALNNAHNVQTELGADKVDLVIVVYGPGIGMLKAESVQGNRIADALKSGVKVLACENTLKTQKLSRDDMLPNLGYVPAGVVELMRRQQQGYAYIRP